MCISVEYVSVKFGGKVPVVTEILGKQYRGHFLWDTL